MGSAKGGDELGETMRILAGPERQKKKRMDIRSVFIIPTFLVRVRSAHSKSLRAYLQLRHDNNTY